MLSLRTAARLTLGGIAIAALVCVSMEASVWLQAWRQMRRNRG